MIGTETRLKIIREVSVRADNFYTQAEELGSIAARVLKEKEENRHRSQITKLENIANNAMKVTDVVNYLKKQTARIEGWQREILGKRLIDTLGFGGTLEQTSQQICTTLSLADPAIKQHIHLLLIREFVRQLAAQYEWKVTQNEPTR